MFAHRTARNTSPSLLLTLEFNSELKVADANQHEEKEPLVGDRQTNNSFIAGEVDEFAMEKLMVRNYAQHALPNPATVSAKVSGMRRYLPYLPDVCFCVTVPCIHAQASARARSHTDAHTQVVETHDIWRPIKATCLVLEVIFIPVCLCARANARVRARLVCNPQTCAWACLVRTVSQAASVNFVSFIPSSCYQRHTTSGEC